MSILRSLGAADNELCVEGKHVYLRLPVFGDFDAWAELRAESRAYLTPWEPVWPHDDLTRPAFRRRLRRYTQELRDETAYPFFIFRKQDNALLGGITLSNIRRGVTQSCSAGYWTGERFAGQGVMQDAVRATIPFVFRELRLHRLEAACLPENEASRAVLLRTGFQYEGLARRYLRINGAWRDHLLFAMIESDPAARFMT